MKKLYIFTCYAYHGGMLQAGALVVLAASKKEAEDEVVLAAMKKWPVAKGWTRHSHTPAAAIPKKLIQEAYRQMK